jgi:hypothetical protein
MRRASGGVCAMLLSLALVAPVAAAGRTDAIGLRKDWAFARCLAITAQGQSAGDDAAKSAAALLERASGGLEVFTRLQALAENYAARSYAGTTGTPYATLKCLDLYHSRALDQLARGLRLRN